MNDQLSIQRGVKNMNSTQKRFVIAGLICALGFTGCGSSKSATASTSTVEMATVNAARNLIGSGVSSCDSTLTSASYDPAGKGSVTSVDGQPVHAGSSAGTSASTDASASGSSATISSSADSSGAGSGTSVNETDGTTTSTDGTDTSADGSGTGTSVDGTDSSADGSGTDTSADGTDSSADGSGTDVSADGTDSSANGSGTDTGDATGTDASASASSSSSSSAGNTSSSIDFSVTADSENQKAALCLASLDRVTWTSGITSFGGYTPSAAMLRVLQETGSTVSDGGKHYGYMLIDINTYAGICYDSDAHFYSSGAAAAAFIIGTLNADATALSNSGEEFQIVAANGSSSQETYTNLMNTYGFTGMTQWLNAGGIDPSIDGYGAAFLSAEDLSRIWLKNYQYFTTDSNGSTVETWFQNPSDSPIRTALGSKYTTWSLPGSYTGGSDAADYDTTVDAGIVSSVSSPYVIAIISDYAAQPDKLVPLVQALDAVHTELMSAAGLS